MPNDTTILTARPGWEAASAPPLLRPRNTRWSGDIVAMLALTALLLGFVWRLFLGWQTPLWLDETFTAAIATQPTFQAAFAWFLHDPGGPLYFTLIWGWVHLFGSSDLALRLPSFVCALAAPLLIAWKGHPDRDVRLCWAALAALWLPGMYFATEARCYALLFLLASAQTIAFLRLMRGGGIHAAWLWAGITVLLVLTHYHALVVSGFEGLFYLALRGKVAIRNWPAALAFLPLAAWMIFHLPLALGFGSADTAWYPTLDGSAALALPIILVGNSPFSWTLLLLLAGTWMNQGAHALLGRARWPYDAADTAAVAAGVLSIALVFVLGLFRPSFTPRYLTPYMPALLLGIVLCARSVRRPSRAVMALLIALWTMASLPEFFDRLAAPQANSRYAYNFAQPSDWLRALGVRKLVFLWDNPSAALVTPDRLAQLGGFFLLRDGLAIPIEAAVPAGHDADPNQLLSSLARHRGDAILWAFDHNVPGSLGVVHPPRLASSDPGWNCRDFGRGSITMLACIRRLGDGD